MSKVIWKDVPNYEGFYQVSSDGHVKSVYRYQKELKPFLSNTGYKRVDLFKNGLRKQFSVHRLVASCFCERKVNDEVVNHIDEDKLNNNFENLEWCTQKENANHGTAIKRRIMNTDYINRKINRKNQILKCSIPVVQISLKGEFIKIWNSASDFCRVNKKTNVSNIRACCEGKRKTAYGFIFRNAEGSVDLSVK